MKATTCREHLSINKTNETSHHKTLCDKALVSSRKKTREAGLTPTSRVQQ